MKTLILIRHAKSSRDDVSLADKERPLNSRGKRDAPRMGERLAKRGVKPDLILSSPAVRALATAELIAEKLDYQRTNIVVKDGVYAGEADELLALIRSLGDTLDCVVLIGHNPELTTLAHNFSSEITHLPTCAVAEFAFAAKSWSHIAKDNSAKVTLDFPKRSEGKA